MDPFHVAAVAVRMEAALAAVALEDGVGRRVAAAVLVGWVGLEVSLGGMVPRVANLVVGAAVGCKEVH